MDNPLESLGSSSSVSPTEPSWFWICYEAAVATNILLTALITAFHAYRLVALWGLLRARHWLLLFHLLMFIGYFSLLPYLIWSLACAFDRYQWQICASNSPLPILLMTVHNLGYFFLNAVYALLGFHARKEIIYARDGPSRWAAGHNAMTALTTIFIVLGLLFFLQPLHPAALTTGNNIFAWTGVATTLASTITVGVLTCTLKFSQRVLPFMSTKLLLLSVFLAFASFLAQAVGAIPEFSIYTLLQVCLVWAEVLTFQLSSFLLAYLFRRHNANEYQVLATLASQGE